MSNRKATDTFPRCPNCDKRGVCMYVGPCLVCACARAQAALCGVPSPTFTQHGSTHTVTCALPRGHAGTHARDGRTWVLFNESTPVLMVNPQAFHAKEAKPMTTATQLTQLIDDVLACALAWEPDAKLIGNVAAGQVAALAQACRLLLPLLAQSTAKHRDPGCTPETCIKCRQEAAAEALARLPLQPRCVAAVLGLQCDLLADHAGKHGASVRGSTHDRIEWGAPAAAGEP